MNALTVAGWSNIVIGILHVVTLIRAREMFYWVGIGPDMDRLSRVHVVLPYLLSVAAGAAFCVCGLYGLSAARVVRPLPLLGPGLMAIAGIFLLRAVGGTGLGGFLEDSCLKENAFSAVALVIGILYAVGAWSVIHDA